MDASQPTVLILTGPPGAGKSTVGRLLAEARPRGVHLESDVFFRFIRSGYIEPWRPASHAQNTTVMRIVANAAAAYAAAGYLTIVDGIIAPRWFLNPLRDALHGSGHAVAYAVLRAPLPVCVERTTGRASERPADPAAIGQLHREFEDLGPLEGHVIDTAAGGPEDVARVVSERLERRTLDLAPGGGTDVAGGPP